MRLVTCAVLLLAACAADRRDGALVQDVVRFADGARVHGNVHAREIHVPRGATVLVEAPVILHATERFLIEGEVRMRDATEQDADGIPPPLVLRCDGRMTVAGAVIGGKGLDRPQDDAHGSEYGGNGGDVWIGAPDVAYAVAGGAARSGDGGRGGPGGFGGLPGSVFAAGEPLGDHGLPILEPKHSRLPTTQGRRGLGGEALPEGEVAVIEPQVGRSEVRLMRYDEWLERLAAALGH